MEADEQAEVYPSFWQALGVTGLLLLLHWALIVLLSAPWLEAELRGRMPVGWLTLLTTTAAFAVTLAWVLRRSGQSPRSVFAFRAVPPLVLMALPLLAGGAAIWISEADNALRKLSVSLTGVPFAATSEVRVSLAAELLLLLALPVAHEALFRGALLPGLLRRHGDREGLLVCAFLEGLFAALAFARFPASAFFAGAALGLLCGYLYLRTANLLPPILLRVLVAGVGLAAVAADLHIPGFTSPGPGIHWQPAWLDLLGVLLLAGGIAILRLGRRDREAARNPLPTHDES